ncbi:MAG: hypothetical protein ACKPKO_38990, partial [Candidatus Fonsibacter sp.]
MIVLLVRLPDATTWSVGVTPGITPKGYVFIHLICHSLCKSNGTIISFRNSRFRCTICRSVDSKVYNV